jgi:TonB family protein
MPMTWGVFRPHILLPNEVDDWPPERKRVVIAHELAHVHRLDWIVQMAARLACVVYWFNPLFWLACNRLYRESEQACDDAVINLGVNPHEYASHLFEIARTLKHGEEIRFATLAMARPSTLEKRFAALLSRSASRRAPTRRMALAVAVATLFMVLPLGAIRLVGNSSTAGVTGTPTVDQYTTPPLYSDEARLRAVEGVVAIEVRVGVNGTVQRLHVIKGIGFGLDENALLAVRDWRFVPAMRNGVPIEATTVVNVEFNLKSAELNELIANDMATRIGPGVIPPQIVHRVEPRYAQTTRQAKPADAVVLDAVIPEDGVPRIVRVIRSLNWEFDESAINALQQWRFSPAMQDGHAVKVRMNIAVHF